MCTIVAKNIDNSWVLAKTRDPVEWMRWDDEMKLYHSDEDMCKKMIVQNPDPHEDGYYGGINEYGVAYVSTYVRTTDNAISYIRRPYVRLILDAKTASDAVKIIRSFNPRIGGNMFVADSNTCFGIEASPSNYFVEQIKNQAAKTNHFLTLPAEDLDMKISTSYKTWSETHLSRASELLDQATSIQDIINLLKDRKNKDEKNAICTMSSEEECFTHSAFVFDTTNILAYYAQGNPQIVPFKRFTF